MKKNSLMFIAVVVILSLILTTGRLISFGMMAEDPIDDYSSGLQEDYYTFEEYEYILLDDGTVEIANYYGDDETLDIPAKIDGKTVTSIGQEAFIFCDNLIEIRIPDSITIIKSNAFGYCDSLTEIV